MYKTTFSRNVPPASGKGPGKGFTSFGGDSTKIKMKKNHATFKRDRSIVLEILNFCYNSLRISSRVITIYWIVINADIIFGGGGGFIHSCSAQLLLSSIEIT